MNEPTVRQPRPISYAVAAGLLFLTASSVQAANLVDVRIGVHDQYTRIVLETDAKAPYRIESSGSRELLLHLSASGGSRMLASPKSVHLVSLTVKPAEAGASEIRVALRGPVEVKELVLSAPPRIVLDLREARAAGATAPTLGKPAPSIPQEDVIPEAAKAPTSEPATPAPAPRAESPEPTLPLRSPTERVRPPAEPAQGVAPGEQAVAPGAPEPDPGATLAAREPRQEAAPVAPPKPSTVPRRIVTPPAPPPEKGLLRALPEPFDEPLVLAVIAAGLILVIALVVMRRRGAARDEEPITPFAAGEPFSVDEQPGGAEQPRVEPEEAEFPVRSARTSAAPSLFDQPVATAQPSGEQQSRGPAMDQVEIGVAPGTAVSAASPGPAREFEQRLAQLEERMQDLHEAKERLERQVAAQTEELRVQRAAIARTQRVLRNLTRPDDEATEPAPKS